MRCAGPWDSWEAPPLPALAWRKLGPWTICKYSLFPQHMYRLGLVGGTHLVQSSAGPGSLLFLFLVSVQTETFADQGCPAFPSLFQPLVEINRVYQRTCA